MHLLVLSAFRPSNVTLPRTIFLCLNAPFGAQCFPTLLFHKVDNRAQMVVSMHLLVLSAFRLKTKGFRPFLSSVSMHLLVLSAFRPCARTWRRSFSSLNAPFGAQCFPTYHCGFHAVVRSGLNAPFGAQCFPTQCFFSLLKQMMSLNAPFGAQCFPTEPERLLGPYDIQVSMHLLVLSAFRHINMGIHHNWREGSQCTFWCSVLSDSKRP